jgi:L-alanine-DL-glutamate epimerase-like enolase superfamily enzyme
VSATWDKLKHLPLRVDGYALDGQGIERDEFVRKTTTIRLQGAGEEGLGEDVVYTPEDHDAAQAAGPVHPLAGEWTLEAFCAQVESLELFPAPPEYPASWQYRVWAYESAALDLALRQAGTTLHEALGREVRPVTFVNSMRLPEPPSFEPIAERLARYPTLRFKLDAQSSWGDDLFEQLAASGAVDSIDLKGQYVGTIVDQGADPALYRRVVEFLPDAWIEDPKLTPETEAVLADVHDRITWDAIIHSVADVDALPFAPQMVNIKPSRSGPLSVLFELYDTCAARGIGAYGGGQTELSVGRGHIQLLAAIFHPDTPNDVAPMGYNEAPPPDGLPASPLICVPDRGFRLARFG